MPSGPSCTTSPENSSPDRASQKATDPGECPGKCTTSSARSPRSITSPCERICVAGAALTGERILIEPIWLSVLEHVVGDVTVGNGILSVRCGEDIRLGDVDRPADKLVMPTDVIAMAMGPKRQQVLLAKLRHRFD